MSSAIAYCKICDCQAPASMLFAVGCRHTPGRNVAAAAMTTGARRWEGSAARGALMLVRTGYYKALNPRGPRMTPEGAPKFGDRKTHQMDPANAREALREAERDVEEGGWPRTT